MPEKHPLLLGCVADDFTGASDVASFINAAGMRCVLYNGLPSETAEPQMYDAAVIALKSRSMPADEAVRETQTAFNFFRNHNAQTLYYKYCSTFDSTPEGNIGPVLDNLLELYDLPYTILCPALPINGRIVQNGILYVNGTPLAQTAMRFHPVNPMWDSDVTKLMESQSKYPCYALTVEQMKHPEQVWAQIVEWKKSSKHFYIVVDYTQEQDGAVIAHLFRTLPLLSGGSALPGMLYRQCAHGRDDQDAELAVTGKFQTCGLSLLIAGSCSETTLKQIAYYQRTGAPSYQIDPNDLLEGKQTIDQIWRFAAVNAARGALLYSSQEHSEVNRQPCRSQAELSEVLDHVMTVISQKAIEAGIENLVVAGGETSGAVMKAIGDKMFEIGASVAPGVPILIPTSKKKMRLVLKSGNFGQENFFVRALEMISKEGTFRGQNAAGYLAGAHAL